MLKIMIVEDDNNINELIEYALSSNGFEVFKYTDGSNLINNITTNKPDLLILDIMLPGKDGISLLKEIRANSGISDLYIIMLTAKSTEIDKIKGFDLGADDYIIKPFSIMELVARVKSIIRRSNTIVKKSNIIEFKQLCIYPQNRRVTIQDEEINLTFKEFELLLYLVENEDIVLSREQILCKVWNYEFQGESRTLDIHVTSLRKKLLSYGDIIKTIRNIGYVIRFK